MLLNKQQADRHTTKSDTKHTLSIENKVDNKCLARPLVPSFIIYYKFSPEKNINLPNEVVPTHLMKVHGAVQE
jgi:hypothetical protein